MCRSSIGVLAAVPLRNYMYVHISMPLTFQFAQLLHVSFSTLGMDLMTNTAISHASYDLRQMYIYGISIEHMCHKMSTSFTSK